MAKRADALTIGLCLLVALVEGFDLQSAGVAGPGISAELRIRAVQMGWLFSSSTLGLFFGAWFGGRLADRIGRRYSLISSMVVFGLASLLTAALSDYSGLVLARLITGLGLGGALPNVVTLTAEAGPTEGAALRVSVMTAAAPLGAAVCALCGFAFDALHWRYIFAVGGLAPLLLAVGLLYMLPESAIFRSIRRSAIPIPAWTALFGFGRTTTTLLLWANFVLIMAIAFVLINWLPTIAVAQGFSPSRSALASLIYNTANCAGGVLFGCLLNRHPPTVVASGYLGIAVSALLFAFAPPQYPWFAVAAALLGFFVGTGQFILFGLSPLFYPDDVRGTGVGAAVAAGRIGAMIGPMLTAVALRSGGHAAAVLTILPLTFMALFMAISLVLRLPQPSIRVRF